MPSSEVLNTWRFVVSGSLKLQYIVLSSRKLSITFFIMNQLHVVAIAKCRIKELFCADNRFTTFYIFVIAGGGGEFSQVSRILCTFTGALLA